MTRVCVRVCVCVCVPRRQAREKEVGGFVSVCSSGIFVVGGGGATTTMMSSVQCKNKALGYEAMVPFQRA